METGERYLLIDRENPKRKIYLSPDELQLMLLLAEQQKREMAEVDTCNDSRFYSLP